MILLALLAAALTPTEVADKAPASAWRPVSLENLLLMETPRGVMAIELAPDFAPEHIASIRRMVAEGRFDGGAVTRVQDNYVVQWAARADPTAPPVKLPAEYERPAAGLTITPLGSSDVYAEAGFWNGWPVALDRTTGTAWLAHCYGSVGVGRENPPDTGDGSELYAVIGHGPRQLDRNIALVGRVIDGIAGYSSLPRGTGDIGFYKTPAEYTPITRVRLASKVPGAPRYEVMDTASPSFAAFREARANRTGFYVRPAGAVDVCNVQVPVRRAK
jgi:peptidylprolyl isomerase